jgi:gluconate 2-dehydrogenase gamma chain
MASYSSDRRKVLKLFGAIGATCAYPFAGDELYGQTAHEHANFVPQSQGRFLNDADFKTIARITDLIIPSTETAGAIQAGVPEYIDLVISRDIDHQTLMADGLRWLDAQAKELGDDRFLGLDERGQLSILEPLCEAADAEKTQARNVQFFALLKRLTADGYYTSKVGLMDELEYKGNAVRSGYPECVHEH